MISASSLSTPYRRRLDALLRRNSQLRATVEHYSLPKALWASIATKVSCHPSLLYRLVRRSKIDVSANRLLQQNLAPRAVSDPGATEKSYPCSAVP